MSSRSKRTHKPTSKFLNYYKKDLASPQNAVEKAKAKQVKNRSEVFSSGKKKQLVLSPEIKEDNEESNPSEEHGYSSTPSEIRRSSRQHKPNQKLKEFLQSSTIDESGSPATPEIPGGSKPKKSMVGSASAKLLGGKNVAAISPMIREEGTPAAFRCSKNISVGLVDCFEGLSNDLAHSYPSQSGKDLPCSKDKISDEAIQKELLQGKGSRGRKGGKRSREEENSANSEEPKRKIQIINPSVLRNLTKTKKSTKITTFVKTVSIDRSQRKTITRNNKSKIAKKSPIPSSSPAHSSGEDAVTSPSSPVLPSQSPVTPLQKKINRMAYQFREKKHQTSPQQDVKETLKKFLVMGTKIANAISETLKHNEEELLSKSSAFERKCLSLVHALAKQGSDLEEDDMEKVIKLLDEEQEERRLYRHTFLESLRVSHLTNMALYSQMLRLLKTL